MKIRNRLSYCVAVIAAFMCSVNLVHSAQVPGQPTYDGSANQVLVVRHSLAGGCPGLINELNNYEKMFKYDDNLNIRLRDFVRFIEIKTTAKDPNVDPHRVRAMFWVVTPNTGRLPEGFQHRIYEVRDEVATMYGLNKETLPIALIVLHAGAKAALSAIDSSTTRQFPVYQFRHWGTLDAGDVPHNNSELERMVKWLKDNGTKPTKFGAKPAATQPVRPILTPAPLASSPASIPTLPPTHRSTSPVATPAPAPSALSRPTTSQAPSITSAPQASVPARSTTPTTQPMPTTGYKVHQRPKDFVNWETNRLIEEYKQFMINFGNTTAYPTYRKLLETELTKRGIDLLMLTTQIQQPQQSAPAQIQRPASPQALTQAPAAAISPQQATTYKDVMQLAEFIENNFGRYRDLQAKFPNARTLIMNAQLAPMDTNAFMAVQNEYQKIKTEVDKRELAAARTVAAQRLTSPAPAPAPAPAAIHARQAQQPQLAPAPAFVRPAQQPRPAAYAQPTVSPTQRTYIIREAENALNTLRQEIDAFQGTRFISNIDLGALTEAMELMETLVTIAKSDPTQASLQEVINKRNEIKGMMEQAKRQ